MRASRNKARRHRVCLLLGSNIQPEENLRSAVELLREQFVVEKVSAVWESPAVGSTGPDFLNAAIMIRTSLNPPQLKARFLRPLEAQLGRVRTADKNAPRTIDIDIIALDADLLDPAVWQHAHAAVPVAELLPCYQSTETGEYLEQAARRLSGTTSMRARPDVWAGLFW